MAEKSARVACDHSPLIDFTVKHASAPNAVCSRSVRGCALSFSGFVPAPVVVQPNVKYQTLLLKCLTANNLSTKVERNR